MNFRNDIQGLRAIAVILVFIFHLSSQYIPGGFIGVDMFFVISGYLITKIIASKISKGTFNIWNFYWSRIKRIIPAYFFLLVFVWIIFVFLFTNSEINKFRSWHFWTFIFNSNYHFSKVDNYFGASSNENPLLHTWTLSVEMQFYLILPIILLLIKNIKSLVFIMCFITIGLITYSTVEIINGNKALMYFSLLSRSPEFLLGSIISLIGVENNERTRASKNILSSLGLTILIGSVVLLNENSFFPGAVALFPCVGTGLLLISNQSRINEFLANRFLVYIGEISYSLYLWHWPIMSFIRYRNETYEFNLTESISVVILTIIFSLCSYYLIERPLRSQSGIKFSLPFAILVVTNIILIICTSFVKNYVTPMPVEYGKPQFGIDSHGRRFKKVEVLGDTTARNKTMLFLGDSHALTFKPYLDKLGKEYKFNFRTITNDLYPTLPNLPDSCIKDINRLEVYHKLSPIIDQEFNSADIIIIFFEANGGNKWKEVIKNMLNNLTSKQRVLFVSDYPSLDKNPARTNSFLKRSNNMKLYNIKYPIIDDELLQIIKQDQQCKYIDLSKYHSYFKDAPYRNDTLMYYDSSHLNHYGAINYENVSGKEFLKYITWAQSDN